MTEKQSITIVKNGPYIVTGKLPIAKEYARIGESGEREIWERGKDITPGDGYSLCRCGQSSKKPFCDGSHVKVKFDGTEVAENNVFLNEAIKLEGPGIDMFDYKKLCSESAFCHLAGGTWENVPKSNNEYSKNIVIDTCGRCPSGRLVAWDKFENKPIEPEFEKSIGVIEDIPSKMSGPLWIKGGIEIISSRGFSYEIRNRVTLCRCGNSTNKPFCDGSHYGAGFNDGDNEL